MDCKKMIVLVSTLSLMGCSSVSSEQKQMYEQGYRVGIKEQIRAIAAQFQGGDFPYYHWASPIVQEVDMPGHIASGVFIPAHKELVIIKPGEWAQSPAYPITSAKENYGPTAHDLALDASDITHLPNGKGEPGDPEGAGKGKDIASGMGGTK